MKIRRIMLIIISAIIMITTFNIGIMGDRVGIEEQIFRKQVIRLEGTDTITTTEENSILNLTYPNVLITTIIILTITYVLCILIAKKNGLYLAEEKQERINKVSEINKKKQIKPTKQIKPNNIPQNITLQEGLQYDQ